MSAQHTPGPWKAVKVTGATGNHMVYMRILSDNFEHPGGIAYASIPVKNRTKKDKQLAGVYLTQGEELARANAELIASAPLLKEENEKMAKAIKLVCECLKDGIPIENGDPIHETLKREFPNLLNP